MNTHLEHDESTALDLHSQRLPQFVTGMVTTERTSSGSAGRSPFGPSGILGPFCSAAQKQPWTLWSWDMVQEAETNPTDVRWD